MEALICQVNYQGSLCWLLHSLSLSPPTDSDTGLIPFIHSGLLQSLCLGLGGREESGEVHTAGTCLRHDSNYSGCLFLVEKVTGGWRPVFYHYFLKRCVFHSKFNVETLSTVLTFFRGSNFMSSLSLKDLFFQTPLH